MTSGAEGGGTGANRRTHTRLSMRVPIRLVAQGSGTAVMAQNRDISWGGVQFIVPKEALASAESVTMTFPWANGEDLTVTATVLRSQTIDDRNMLVAARFSSLSTADQRRLEKLLYLLRDGDEQSRALALVPSLEVLFNDADDMRTKLGEVAQGRFSMTVFRAYRIDQSIRVVLAGSTDLPALQLRGRVQNSRPLTSGAMPDWPIYELDLRFEHPLAELKAMVESLTMRLARTRRPRFDWADTKQTAGEP